MIVSVRAMLDLDIYPLSNLFVHDALNGLNLVEVSQCSLCILTFTLVFTLYLSNAVVVGIAHKPPRSL